MYLIEILHDTRNYIRWNVDQYVPKQIAVFSIVGHGKNTIHLIPKGKTYRERISISKKAMKVIRKVPDKDEKPPPCCQNCIKKNETVRYCGVYMDYCKYHINSAPNESDSKPLSTMPIAELRRRASKCFTNAGDAMIALQELKRRREAN